MNQAKLSKLPAPTVFARDAMHYAARFWFVVAFIGHWIFLAYIVAAFVPPVFRFGLDALANSHLPNGHVTGDVVGNLAGIAHVLLAAIIIGGGPLQLIPAIRSRFPAFHRALGRTYVTVAVLTSLAGLYLVWTRGTVGDLIQHIGISLDGILIIVFAVITVRFAIVRDIRRHRRWALRLFMVASGVWFFRVGLMGWTMLTGGAGIDFETFTGPFLSFLSFGQYLLPLAVLEAYFRAQDHWGNGGRLALGGLLVILTLLMGVGIFAATMGLWLPRF